MWASTIMVFLMISNNLIQHLQERGLIAQVTDKKALAERLVAGPIVLYCGFDPTADSLHLGHLVPLLCLKHFQLAGHRPVALMGGATGLIGDPSFKTTERKLNTTEIVQKWSEKIKHQISPFLDFNCGNNSAIIANNYDWFGSMNVLTFLRDIGKHFSVNQMINKEAVKKRLNRDDSGISFTEFSYNLLQSYDFAYLNKQYGVILQIGGSDQWGNITNGINLTRRMHQNSVYGLTVPLITKSDGSKFGKTERDAVWLDANKTSPYKFYQFWINTADNNVYRFFKFFTFMDIAAINALEAEDRDSGKPRAQYILAEEITRMVHGEQGLAAAQRISTSLFTGALSDLTEGDFAQLAQDGIPTVILETGADLQHALVAAELVPSRGQARTTISSRAITVNGEKQEAVEYVFRNTDRLYGRYTLLRRGKKHYCLINWE
ncbi:MAG: tyrosine--tRNA ligase [Sodalis sp. Ffu]|nr:MAG: tyrosine--tRNA ligase [Sodalis sp. Ffu]